MLLAQAAEVAELGSKAIDASSQYGGEIWLLSLVLVTIGALAGVWLWQVSIPNQRSHRDNATKLAECVQQLTAVAGSTYATTVNTNELAMETHTAVRSLCASKVVECDILQKLGERANLDIGAELGHLKGLNQASADIVSRRTARDPRVEETAPRT